MPRRPMRKKFKKGRMFYEVEQRQSYPTQRKTGRKSRITGANLDTYFPLTSFRLPKFFQIRRKK